VPQLSVARVGLVETEDVSGYTPGRGNFIAAKRGKRTNSSAHWLGAALLVPRAGALEMVKANCTLAQIALHFGVSESFCEWRIRQSGIDKQIERWRRCWRD